MLLSDILSGHVEGLQSPKPFNVLKMECSSQSCKHFHFNFNFFMSHLGRWVSSGCNFECATLLHPRTSKRRAECENAFCKQSSLECNYVKIMVEPEWNVLDLVMCSLSLSLHPVVAVCALVMTSVEQRSPSFFYNNCDN